MLNLINRIIELTVERVLNLIDRARVEQKVVDLLVSDGIDHRELAGHIDSSEVASHIEVDYSELASEIDPSDIASEVMDDYGFQNRMEDHVRETVESEVSGLDERVKALEAARTEATTVAGPTPVQEQSVEVPAALTERLLDLAVTRLLEMADEAARDGKV